MNEDTVMKQTQLMRIFFYSEIFVVLLFIHSERTKDN